MREPSIFERGEPSVPNKHSGRSHASMSLTIFIACLLTLFTLAYLWIKKRFSFFKDHGFLYDEPHFPLGNIEKGKHLAEVFKKLYDKFKGQVPAFGIFFSVKANFIICDLDLVKDILIRDFEAFHNRGLFYNKKDDPLTGHLLTLENLEWKNMRNKLTPTFTSGKMKMMFSTLLDVSYRMVEKLKSRTNLDRVDVKEVLAQYTTDVIGNVAFGLEMNAIDDPNSEFRRMGAKFFARGSNVLIRLLLLTSFRDLARKLKMKLIPEDISSFFLKVVKDTVSYRLQNDIQRNDMMDILLKVRDESHGEDGKLTVEEIAAQCFIFFIGGFETSSSTGTFVLFNLAMHQNIQDKVRDEIKTVLARHENKITYDAMQDMKYLQMVIDGEFFLNICHRYHVLIIFDYFLSSFSSLESLRLYPPVFQVIRQASRDYKIPNSKLTIPKDSLVMIPSYCIQRDPEYYPDPEKFDPERFSDENKAKRHPMTFLPFGQGNRNCIGFRFGLMQTKIGLIQLLMNYKIQPTSETPQKIVLEPTVPVLSSSTDMWLRFEKLEK
jgi:cytochrome P450 family 6